MPHSPFSLFSLLSLLHQHHFSTASLHTTRTIFRSQKFNSNPKNTTKPTTFFEVTKPLNLPKTKPLSLLLLQHDFGYTYTKPPVLSNYTPPSQIHQDGFFSAIVLEWRATCKGRQFDRIFGVWLGGVEILRSCTAEPTSTGIFWTVKKDITKYYSLLRKNQTLSVYLGNLVDSTYTGVYHVEIYVHFYPSEEAHSHSHSHSCDNHVGSGCLRNVYDSPADLILPVSRKLPLNDGLWFEIVTPEDVSSKEVVIPRNVYRAVLEVYVSFHKKDEFWFGNYPNEFIAVNNLTGVPGNGSFREVVVSLDGKIVGAVWPFTVIYTGGVNPLMWKPISGIGSFDLPTYDIEITPFLGMILDGKSHMFGFSVTNALNVWYVDANLHLWLDEKSDRTGAELLTHETAPLLVSLAANFTTKLSGTFYTNVTRSLTSTGRVTSSHGTITTKWSQDFSYANYMEVGNEGNLQIVKQMIHFNDSVEADTSSSNVFFLKSLKRFPFHLYSDDVDQGNKTFTSKTNVTLGFDEERVEGSGSESYTSYVKNLQEAEGYMLVQGNLVVEGLGSAQQTYLFKENDSLCYLRNISSSNYTILYDHVSTKCEQSMGLGVGKYQYT